MKKTKTAAKPKSNKKAPVAGETATGKQKLVPRDEFRFNYATNHPNHVFGEQGDKYKSVGITHESETFGRKNMPLKQNPRAGKTEKSYIRNGIITEKKKYYSKNPLSDYQFSKEDKANVKSKERNYKKSQKKKRQKK